MLLMPPENQTNNTFLLKRSVCLPAQLQLKTDFTRAAFESNIKNGTRFSENLVVIHNNVKLDPSMTINMI